MTEKRIQLLQYKCFIDAFTKAHPKLTRSTCHFNGQVQWMKIKHDEKLIQSAIEKYRSMISVEEKSDEKQRKRSLSSDDEYEPYDSDLESEKVPMVEPTFHLRDQAQATEFNDENKPWVRLSLERARARAEAKKAKLEARRLASLNRSKHPVQDAVIQKIKEITERIDSLVQVKNMGLSTAESNNTLKKLLEQKREQLAELSKLKSKQRAALKYRLRKKRCIESICEADPESAAQLLRFYKPTLLRVQIDNICPELLETLEELARICGAVENNPRYINTPPCASLDELRAKVRERSYDIRRTTNFYRLIPARTFMEDGKRHVASTPVRLRKLQGIQQTVHPDSHFVNAMARHIKDIAATFGNECVFYLIEDRKASIRVGRALNREYSPLLLHLDYQVSSTDSGPIPRLDSFQFKPVAYASCLIDETGTVTFSGPTYVSIRSEKHDRYTTDSEDADLDIVVKLREFEKTARNHIGAIKPIFIINVESLEPNDYTRYPKTLVSAIGKFKRYNLDALFIFAQAPGHPSSNISERRFAVLAQDLTGLVLPYDYFGTHLNLGGYTIDAELEKTNLKKTGEVLAEIWNLDKIDGQPIVVQFIDPPAIADQMVRIVDCRLTLNKIIDEICDEEEDLPLHLRVQQTRNLPPEVATVDTGKRPSYNIDEYWCATHVFQTQYSIQIVRCTKPECCGPWRSNYIQLFPHRFLPPPVPFHRSSRGVRLVEVESSAADRQSVSPYYGSLYQRIQFHGLVIEGTQNALLAYDAFCPSLQNKLHLRICSICKQYIPLGSRLRNHYRVHQQRFASALTSSVDETNKKEDESTDDPDPVDPVERPLVQINPAQKSVFLFSSLVEWLKPDFEEVPVVPTKPKSSVTIANEMIRKERQLAALAAAKEAKHDPTKGLVESVATISLDNALMENEENSSQAETKTEENIQIVNVKSEMEKANDSADESEVVVEEAPAPPPKATNSNANTSEDDLLEQYDDLRDLLDQI